MADGGEQHLGDVHYLDVLVGAGLRLLLGEPIGQHDAKKSHAPMLAICGQVPLAELGSDYFQEVDNDLLFRDVAMFTRTITATAQATTLLEQAVQHALNGPGVSVLTLPGDIGGLDVPKHAKPPRFIQAHPATARTTRRSRRPPSSSTTRTP